jgi:polysaccharide biosynthesis/export protein
MLAARRIQLLLWVVLGLGLAASGCQHFQRDTPPLPDVPRENQGATIREYYIHPPDVIVIDLIRAVPLPPYKIKPQDLIFINVRGTPAEDPIKGAYRVEPEGVVRLGPLYGSVKIADMTIDEATRELTAFLKKEVKDPQVSVTLEETRGVQLVRGQHLVRPDGSVSLGIYGRVTIAGMTQEMAKAAIEDHLSQFFLNPTITIDIAGFNSSVY